MEHSCAALMAILFVSGEAVSRSELETLLEAGPLEVDAAITQLVKFLEKTKSPLELLSLEDSVQLAVRRDYLPYVLKLSRQKAGQSLSGAALEALAVIAYNQPVTRSFVEQVRGVNSNTILTGLCDRGLIEEAGRLELPGRPIAYRTTQQFLRSFGLQSLADLPQVPSPGDREEEEPAGEEAGAL